MTSEITYVAFNPSATSNFQFQVTFDGSDYTVIVNWNLFGQRYYVNVYALTGELIVCLPLIGSPNFFNISLVAGYFTTLFVYRAASGTFEIFEP